MSFLYPQFLFGLLALGIPVIIHLFNFRKTKKIYFSNTLFLKNLKETTTTKLKIKHWLILLARLLFVFFLVITFAQPYLPTGDRDGAPDAEGQNQVYIYLDNSLSMSSELGSNMRGIDQGINYIEEIIGLYPRNTSYHLLTNEFGSSSRVSRTGTELSDYITEIGLTGVARSFEEVISRVTNDQQTGVDAQNTGNADVYMISDFQQSTGGDLNVIKTDTADQIYLVPVRSSYESNVFVDSVFLASPFMLADETNELTIVLRNDNEDAVEDFLVRMLINDQQVANGSVNLPSQDTASITFSLNFPLEKTNRCQVVFEDYPVTFDNEFYFTLNLGDRIRVLEITDGGAASQPSSIAKVYANQQVFDFQSFGINNLDYSLIEATDLLVLNELGAGSSASRAVVPYIQDFLANGGHILYIPPANGNLAFLQEVTGNGNLSGGVVAATDSTGSSQNALANLDMANPFFANMFEGNATNFEMPTARRLLDHNLRGEALLKYRTGDPFLLSLSRSYIRTDVRATNPVYVFTAPLRSEFTSLYRHAIFVPVMYRLASMSKSLNNKLYYYANESLITLETTNFANQQQTEAANANQRYLYKLYQDAQEVIPSQRVTGGRLFMEIPLDIVEPGFYNMTAVEEGSSRNAVEDEPLTSLAFNVEKDESLVRRYSVEDLQQTFSDTSNVRIYEAENTEDFSSMLREQQADVSLWKYALLLALGFLLIEILLIRFL